MVFTNTGQVELAKWLAGESATAPTHIAVGDDSTTPTDEDTTLISEVLRDAIETTSRDDNKVTFSMIVPSTQGNGTTFREAGLFNASLSGTMFNRFAHSSLTKTSSLEVQYEITLQVTN